MSEFQGNFDHSENKNHIENKKKILIAECDCTNNVMNIKHFV